MRYFLCLMIAIVCEAARIPRTSEQTYFPNFQSVYHGHGASSYQNVQLDQAGVPLFGGYKAQDETYDLGEGYYAGQTADNGQELAGRLAGVPFEEIATNHVDLKPQHSLPQHYESLDHEQNYDYQL